MQSTKLEVPVNPCAVAQEVSYSVGIPSPARSHQSMVRTGDLLVDLETHVGTADGKPVRLTGKEYSILELLSLRQGITVTSFLATSTAERTSRNSRSSTFLSAICVKS